MAIKQEYRTTYKAFENRFNQLTEGEKQDLMDQASFQLFSVSFNDALLACASVVIEEEVRKQTLTKAVVLAW